MKNTLIFLFLVLFSACKKETPKEPQSTINGYWIMDSDTAKIFKVTTLDSCTLAILFNEAIDAPPSKGNGLYNYKLEVVKDTTICIGQGVAPMFKFWKSENRYTGVVVEWRQIPSMGTFKKITRIAN